LRFPAAEFAAERKHIAGFDFRGESSAKGFGFLRAI
jgi:hypothetical protein